MPLTIDEYSYVIVDNGAANPGELATGSVHKVDDERRKAALQQSPSLALGLPAAARRGYVAQRAAASGQAVTVVAAVCQQAKGFAAMAKRELRARDM
jgi:hypothetical protein